MSQILGMALGAVDPQLAQDLSVTLPEQYLPDWSVRDAASSTDGLVALTAHTEECPWRTLLVTPWLDGSVSLAHALVTVRARWPQLRIAVLLGADAPGYRPLIETLAARRIWNILIAEDFQFSDVAELVMDDWPWDRIAPFLEVPQGINPPPMPTLPSHIVTHDPAPVERGPSTTVAVVGATGGVGKTGVLVNVACARAGDGVVVVDLDLAKPAVPLYFRDAADPVPVHLQQLLTRLSATGWDWEDRDGESDPLTPQDKQHIRDYVHSAVELRPGIRLVPGPSRQHLVPSRRIPGLARALLHEAGALAPVVLVDLPASLQDPVWEETVRAVDQVIVVTTPEAVAVLETIQLLERLDHLRVPRQVVHLVVNRIGRGTIPADEVAAVHCKHPLAAAIGDQPKGWAEAFSAHQPIALRVPKPWGGLAQRIAPAPETVDRRAQFAARPRSASRLRTRRIARG